MSQAWQQTAAVRRRQGLRWDLVAAGIAGALAVLGWLRVVDRAH